MTKTNERLASVAPYGGLSGGHSTVRGDLTCETK